MKERKVKRVMEERKKLQGDRSARHAFKDKLEDNTKEYVEFNFSWSN